MAHPVGGVPLVVIVHKLEVVKPCLKAALVLLRAMQSASRQHNEACGKRACGAGGESEPMLCGPDGPSDCQRSH